MGLCRRCLYLRGGRLSYKSPIEVCISQLQFEREKNLEDGVIKAIQNLDITVAKDELIKALRYDREQYETGYQDGYNADKWISVNDRLPKKDGRYLAYGSAFGRCLIGILYYDTRIKHFSDGEVTHWQPLPEIPKELR